MEENVSLLIDRLNTQILESMDDWVRVIDRNGKQVYMNSKMRQDCKLDSYDKKCSFKEDILIGDSIIPRSISLVSLLTRRSFQRQIRIGEREFEVKSSPIENSKKEVNYVVEVFRDITAEKESVMKMTELNNRLTGDSKFAGQIQTQLLPKKGKIGSMDVDYYYRPSENLSGDMFDVIKINEDKVGIYICDVVGHGIAASMLTMFIRQTFRAIITEKGGENPAQTLYELRRRFSEMKLGDNLYFTMFYGVYSKDAHNFTYCNAGHNCCPVLKLKDGYRVLQAKGVPICELFSSMTYKEDTIRLELGDKLIFYTDGFIEYRNYDNDEFGMDRFIKSVMEDGNIIDNVVKDLINFSFGKIDDDMALMIATVVE